MLSDVKEYYNYNPIKNSKALSVSDLHLIKSELKKIIEKNYTNVVDINKLFNILFTNIDDIRDDYEYFYISFMG